MERVSIINSNKLDKEILSHIKHRIYEMLKGQYEDYEYICGRLEDLNFVNRTSKEYSEELLEITNELLEIDSVFFEIARLREYKAFLSGQ